MTTQMTVNPLNEPDKYKRKIYHRDEMFRYFYCPKEIPDYLKEFSEILNDNVNESWYKRPLPKFEEMVQKSIIAPRHMKLRQRTVSNQSIEVDKDINPKFSNQLKSSTIKPKVETFNRFNNFNEPKLAINTNKVVEREWQTVELKVGKNLSKQYVSNNVGPENHWKKWNKDRVYNDNNKDKTSSAYPRNEKTNNFVVTKVDDNKQDNLHRSADTGGTEDIWQEDWDTDLHCDYEDPLITYSLPPPSLDLTHLSQAAPPSIDITRLSQPPPTQFNDDHQYSSWFYIDKTGTTIGPHLAPLMADYLATGVLDHATPIRRRCDERFLLLAEYRALYGRVPFTDGPTVPPILTNTVVHIDPMQLAIGVNQNSLHEVFSNATCLSPKIAPFMQMFAAPHDTSSADKQAFYEEKRKFEEEKANLERERQILLDEREKASLWKVQMEQEMEAKLAALLLQQSTEVVTKAVVSDAVNQPDDGMEMDQCSVLPIVTEPTTPSIDVHQNKVPTTPVVDMHQRKVPTTPVVDVHQSKVPTTPVIDEHQTKVPTTKAEVPLPVAEDERTNVPGNDWMSIRDPKNNKKNKKSKSKTAKAVIPETVTIDAAKRVEVEDAPKVSKESAAIRIVSREFIDEFKHGAKIPETLKAPEVTPLWSIKPVTTKPEAPRFTKSLVEIQAEEAAAEKVRQEAERALNLSRASEAGKITSFKESLLKSVKTPTMPVQSAARTPKIPAGKSIWDMCPAEDDDDHGVATVVEVTRPVVPAKSKREPAASNCATGDDGTLSTWCRSRLSKYEGEVDVATVVELLREVPIDSVTEMVVELLDDSAFSREFAREFVTRRRRLEAEAAASKGADAGGEGEVWQKVKKTSGATQPAAAPTKTSSSASGKSGKGGKKKMVVIDLSKFRST